MSKSKDFTRVKRKVIVHTICGSDCEYNVKHDEYFCEGCDLWWGDECGNEGCGYCSDRPSKPSEVTP